MSDRIALAKQERSSQLTIHFIMATKVTPTKSYIREIGDVFESGRLQLNIFSKYAEKKHMAEKIFSNSDSKQETCFAFKLKLGKVG